MQCGSVILFINTAHNRFTNDVALTIHNAGGGEGHNAEGKLTGITGRVKIDVAECSPGLFQNLFGSGNVVRVAIKGFCVDTDHLAALLLNALIQCVKVVHLVHTGLAAAEPEIYNGERIIGKKTAAYAVAIQILSFKLRECAGRLRHRLAGSFILRQCCDLCFDLTDFVRIGL